MSILTGNKNVDLLILSYLDDRSLLSFCKVNQYAKHLCRNEYFWGNRFIKKFGDQTKRNDRTWKNFYLNVLKYRIEDQPDYSTNKSIVSILNMKRDGLTEKKDWDLFQYFEYEAIDYIENVFRQVLSLQATVGRENNELVPYTTEQLKKFLKKNEDRIAKSAIKMYNAYKKDNDLEELIDPQHDWYTEYLDKLLDKIYSK